MRLQCRSLPWQCLDGVLGEEFCQFYLVCFYSGVLLTHLASLCFLIVRCAQQDDYNFYAWLASGPINIRQIELFLFFKSFPSVDSSAANNLAAPYGIISLFY